MKIKKIFILLLTLILTVSLVVFMTMLSVSADDDPGDDEEELPPYGLVEWTLNRAPRAAFEGVIGIYEVDILGVLLPGNSVRVNAGNRNTNGGVNITYTVPATNPAANASQQAQILYDHFKDADTAYHVTLRGNTLVFTQRGPSAVVADRIINTANNGTVSTRFIVNGNANNTLNQTSPAIGLPREVVVPQNPTAAVTGVYRLVILNQFARGDSITIDNKTYVSTGRHADPTAEAAAIMTMFRTSTANFTMTYGPVNKYVILFTQREYSVDPSRVIFAADPLDGPMVVSPQRDADEELAKLTDKFTVDAVTGGWVIEGADAPELERVITNEALGLIDPKYDVSFTVSDKSIVADDPDELLEVAGKFTIRNKTNAIISATNESDIEIFITVYPDENIELTFEVLDEEDEPVIGASVELNINSETKGETVNADGKAKFIVPKEGEYGYIISMPEFQTIKGTVTLEDEPVLVKKMMEVQMYGITFNITDHENNPVNDARVEILGVDKTVTNNDDGTYTISLPIGEYSWVVCSGAGTDFKSVVSEADIVLDSETAPVIIDVMFNEEADDYIEVTGITIPVNAGNPFRALSVINLKKAARIAPANATAVLRDEQEISWAIKPNGIDPVTDNNTANAKLTTDDDGNRILTAANPGTVVLIATIADGTKDGDFTDEIELTIIGSRERGIITVALPAPEDREAVPYLCFATETMILPDGFEIRSFSVDGGMRWRDVKSSDDFIANRNISKLLNRGTTGIMVSDGEIDRAKGSNRGRPVVTATQYTFTPTAARPRLDKFGVNYAILGPETIENGFWTFAEKGARTPFSKQTLQIAGSDANNARDPGIFVAFSTDGLGIDTELREVHRSERRTVFVRTEPKVAGENGAMVNEPASRPKRFTINALQRAPRDLKLDKNNVASIAKDILLLRFNADETITGLRAATNSKGSQKFEAGVHNIIIRRTATEKRPASVEYHQRIIIE